MVKLSLLCLATAKRVPLIRFRKGGNAADLNISTGANVSASSSSTSGSVSFLFRFL